MSLSAEDRRHLLRAVALAREHMEAGEGGPFGAVIVRHGQVLAEGWNQVTSSNDPTAHAEVVAIRRACRAVDTFALEGAVLYASCEPCPMCLAAAYWARLSGVVYASTRDEAAAAGFDDAFIYDEMPKPPDRRLMPMQHAPVEEARAAFAEWMKKADRIAY
ncbi:MAG: nucleoside deaminase [Microvirga sp.]